MLEVDSLEKSFGATQAVRGVSFSAKPGEVLGFLGPNGAGKSTTLRMVAGVFAPDAGEARIDGISIQTHRRQAQAKLGYLPEGAPLYNDMTPREFLRFVARAHGLEGTRRRDAIDKAAADARIGGVLTQTISGLSKGFRRRVGLAAAILHDPPVLVLDEPMDGLDPNQKRAVRALIARLAETKTIIVSTHTLDEVPTLCSRVVIIDQGRVVADDTPEGLIRRSPEGDFEAVFAELTDQAEVA